MPASEFATATSAPLCACTPTRHGTSATTVRTTSAKREGTVPPLVSQRATQSTPAPAAVFKHCSEYAWFEKKPSKKCSASKMTVRPLPLRKLIESCSIARFSSSVVSRMCSTCWSLALPTIVTTGVFASTRARRLGSESALPPARRVEPKAAILALRRRSSPARAKNSASFGFEPGQPPSM